MNIGTSNLNIYVKKPGEVLPIDVEFDKPNILPRGATKIVSATASAKRWKRKFLSTIEPDATLLSQNSPSVLPPNETRVRVIASGGIDGYDYGVSVTANFDNGAICIEEIYIKVINGVL